MTNVQFSDRHFLINPPQMWLYNDAQYELKSFSLTGALHMSNLRDKILPRTLSTRHCLRISISSLKGALYIIWCGVNRLGDSGVKVV